MFTAEPKKRGSHSKIKQVRARLRKNRIAAGDYTHQLKRVEGRLEGHFRIRALLDGGSESQTEPLRKRKPL